jgi:hypothetical protein
MKPGTAAFKLLASRTDQNLVLGGRPMRRPHDGFEPGHTQAERR